MKILLACSAGMSTSLLEAAVQKYMKEIGETDGKCLALSSGEAKDVYSEYDVILLGPQIGFMLSEFKSQMEGKPIAVIPPAIYARHDGEKIYNLALQVINENK